jgi:hypothetical protein
MSVYNFKEKSSDVIGREIQIEMKYVLTKCMENKGYKIIYHNNCWF